MKISILHEEEGPEEWGKIRDFLKEADFAHEVEECKIDITDAGRFLLFKFTLSEEDGNKIISLGYPRTEYLTTENVKESLGVAFKNIKEEMEKSGMDEISSKVII